MERDCSDDFVSLGSSHGTINDITGSGAFMRRTAAGYNMERSQLQFREGNP